MENKRIIAIKIVAVALALAFVGWIVYKAEFKSETKTKKISVPPLTALPEPTGEPSLPPDKIPWLQPGYKSGVPELPPEKIPWLNE